MATQTEAVIGFAKWAAVCGTNGLRTSPMMIAESDAYGALVLESGRKVVLARDECARLANATIASTNLRPTR
jgi:hypothetical protein